MQHLFRYIPIGLALLLVIMTQQGCNQNINPTNIPHDKRLVINGFLRPGVSVRNILIGQSTPATDTFYVAKTRVFDAKASISVDGRTYPLQLQPDSLAILQAVGVRFYPSLEDQPTYYQAPELIPEAGKTYTLTVEWQGLRASAKTIVPPAPEIVSGSPKTDLRLDSVRRNEFVGGVSRTYMEPRYTGSASFRVKSSLQSQFLAEDFDMRDVRLPQPLPPSTSSLEFDFGYGVSENIATSNGEIAVNTSIFISFVTLRTALPLANFNIGAKVFGYDEAYIRYVQTSRRGFSGSGLFGASGQNPIWNIQGQGVGLFIGKSTAATVVFRP